VPQVQLQLSPDMVLKIRKISPKRWGRLWIYQKGKYQVWGSRDTELTHSESGGDDDDDDTACIHVKTVKYQRRRHKNSVTVATTKERSKSYVCHCIR